MLGQLAFNSHVCVGQDLSHRKSAFTLYVEDSNGNALTDATIDIKMNRHAFRFGTQVRDRFFSITESEFNSLSATQKQGLLPDLGEPRFTPTWQDAENYRAAVIENFNHVVPTTGMQWVAFNNKGPTVPDAAINLAQANNMDVTGASVVWQRDRWPTPEEFRSANTPDAQDFKDALIEDRLSANGIIGRYSSAGAGPNITDWKVLNEPLHETYYADTFVDAGLYADHTAAMTDYFVRANAIRPDALLSINDFNILNSGSDTATEEYAALINDLLAAGAPIDKIGVQAHISRNDITKADITRRLDILAATGLKIEITEFDSRDDASQLSPAEQEIIFQNMLEASFEHTEVDGFIMWGIWDPGHWRGNGPLYDEDWNIKTEASPWFDLVRGDWMPDLNGLALDSEGKWVAPDDLFNGTYQFTIHHNGSSFTYDGYDLTSDGSFVFAVPEPTAGIFLAACLLTCIGRRYRTATTG